MVAQPIPQKVYRSWAEMYEVACEIVALLRPFCARLHVAGSLRRGKAQVGDIELVAISAGDALHLLCDHMITTGEFAKRRKSNGALLAWGDRFKAFTFQDVPVDLFITTPHQFGLIYLIRTGPGSSNDQHWKGGANQVLVTSRSKGGLLSDDMKVANGWLWQGEQALSTPEEPDVYRLLGIPYIAPYNRDVDEYLRRRRDGLAGVEALRDQQCVSMSDASRAEYWPCVGYRYTPGTVYRMRGVEPIPYWPGGRGR